MTAFHDAICEGDLYELDTPPPAIQCSRCDRWFSYASDTGLCETCEGDEDVATLLTEGDGR